MAIISRTALLLTAIALSAGCDLVAGFGAGPPLDGVVTPGRDADLRVGDAEPGTDGAVDAPDTDGPMDASVEAARDGTGPVDCFTQTFADTSNINGTDDAWTFVDGGVAVKLSSVIGPPSAFLVDPLLQARSGKDLQASVRLRLISTPLFGTGAGLSLVDSASAPAISLRQVYCGLYYVAAGSARLQAGRCVSASDCKQQLTSSSVFPYTGQTLTLELVVAGRTVTCRVASQPQSIGFVVDASEAWFTAGRYLVIYAHKLAAFFDDATVCAP